MLDGGTFMEKELSEKVIKNFKFIKAELSEKGFCELKGVFTAKNY